MSFEQGMPKVEGSGRKPGSLNKKNQEIQELAKEMGCNPALILMMIAMGDGQALGSDELIDLDRRKDAAIQLMPYLYGKRKPVDSKGDDSDSLVSLFLGQLNDRG